MRYQTVYIVLMLVCGWSMFSYAQNPELCDYTCQVMVNTIDEPEIWLTVKFPTGIGIDTRQTKALLKKDDFFYRVRSAKNNEALFERRATLNIYERGIAFIFSPTNKIIQLACDPNDSLYLSLKKDITVIFKDSSTCILSKESLKENSLSYLRLTSQQCNMLRESTFQKRVKWVNLAHEIAEDDSLKEYVLTYRYVRSLAFIPHSLFSSKGRLSDKRYNPLNELEFAYVLSWPLRGRVSKEVKDGKTTSGFPTGRIFFRMSLVSNQPMDTSLFKCQLGLKDLIPNFIDLTGGANRLYLKPLLEIGCEYLRHFQSQPLYGGKRDTWGSFMRLYYYIPVVRRYALIVDAEVEFSQDIYPDYWLWRYSVTFAYDLPFEELKTLIKYERGRNGFSLESNSLLMVGLFIDFVP